MKILQDPEVGKPMRFDRKGTREIYIKPFRLSYIYDKNRDILIFLDFMSKLLMQKECNLGYPKVLNKTQETF